MPDIAYCHSNSSGSYVFWLQPEELNGNHSCCCLSSLLLCWQQDVPCHKAPMTEILTRDGVCSEEVLKEFFLQPRKPPGSEVYNNQQKDPGFNFLCDLRDGQDFIALEVLGILVHPVPFVFLQILQLNSPGSWCLNRAGNILLLANRVLSLPLSSDCIGRASFYGGWCETLGDPWENPPWLQQATRRGLCFGPKKGPCQDMSYLPLEEAVTSLVWIK